MRCTWCLARRWGGRLGCRRRRSVDLRNSILRLVISRAWRRMLLLLHGCIRTRDRARRHGHGITSRHRHSGWSLGSRKGRNCVGNTRCKRVPSVKWFRFHLSRMRRRRRRNVGCIGGMHCVMVMLRVIHNMRRIMMRIVPLLRCARRGLRRIVEVCDMGLYDFLFP